MNGTTNLKGGGLGAVGVSGSAGKKKVVKKTVAAKKTPAKKPAETKKVNLFTKMPWSK